MKLTHRISLTMNYMLLELRQHLSLKVNHITTLNTRTTMLDTRTTKVQSQRHPDLELSGGKHQD